MLSVAYTPLKVAASSSNCHRITAELLQQKTLRSGMPPASCGEPARLNGAGASQVIRLTPAKLAMQNYAGLVIGYKCTENCQLMSMRVCSVRVLCRCTLLLCRLRNCNCVTNALLPMQSMIMGSGTAVKLQTSLHHLHVIYWVCQWKPSH
jgi:hypothetical protein